MRGPKGVPREATPRAAGHLQKLQRIERHGYVTSLPQAPPMKSRPAAGAAHGVDVARTPDLPNNVNPDHLRAHVLRGSTSG